MRLGSRFKPGAAEDGPDLGLILGCHSGSLAWPMGMGCRFGSEGIVGGEWRNKDPCEGDNEYCWGRGCKSDLHLTMYTSGSVSSFCVAVVIFHWKKNFKKKNIFFFSYWRDFDFKAICLDDETQNRNWPDRNYGPLWNLMGTYAGSVWVGVHRCVKLMACLYNGKVFWWMALHQAG